MNKPLLLLIVLTGVIFSPPLGVTHTCLHLQGCVRYGTGILGTGMDVVPSLPKCAVTVLMSHRSYRSVRYRYGCRTELTEVYGTGMDIVPSLLKCPVPVLMSYRTY